MVVQALAVAAVVAASGARSASGAGRGCCGSRTVVTLVAALTAANVVAGTVAVSEAVYGKQPPNTPGQNTRLEQHEVANSEQGECFFKLAWLVLGGDPAARSHWVEQLTAL